MARFNTNENVPVQVLAELRRLGHDVVTSLDAGKANSAMPDAEALSFAVADGRILGEPTRGLVTARRVFLLRMLVLNNPKKRSAALACNLYAERS